MANYNALVTTGGTTQQIHTPDNLVTGQGLVNESGAMPINGIGGVNIQGNGTTAVNVNAAGTSITVQAGATLAATSTGNINLPNNASARFQIQGTGVSANVTATNLGTLTAGAASNADGLHTHADLSGSSPQLIATSVTTTAMTGGTGQAAYVSSAATVSPTSNAATTTSRFLGFYEGTSGQVIVAGVIPDALMTTAGGSPSNGAPVFLAASADDTNTGAGKLTATAPSAAGSVVAEVGIVIDNSNYAGAKTARILIQPKGIILL